MRIVTLPVRTFPVARRTVGATRPPGTLRRTATLALLLAVVLATLAPATAGPELRVELLARGTDAATLELVLAGLRNPEKVREKLQLRVDGLSLVPAAVAVEGGRLRIRLVGVPDAARRLEVALGKEPVVAVSLAAATAAEAPFNDWVVYHAYLATFRNGDRGNDGQVRGWRDPKYAGGDLAGLKAALPHIAELGANAIWISPMFAADTSHGYDVRNYYRIGDSVGVGGDPAASLALYKSLAESAQERGVRLVLDIPLNHAHKGYELPAGDPNGRRPRSSGARQDAEKLWESWGGNYRYWVHEDAGTRAFLTDVGLHWLGPMGAAGLRLDYVRGVPRDFWAAFHRAVKEKSPGAFLLGECWMDDKGIEGNIREIASYYRTPKGEVQFDSLLDFPMQAATLEVYARGADATLLEETLQAAAAAYPPDAAPSYFLDNHDLARFMDWAGDPRKLVAAAGFLFAQSGPQVLFYGTETALGGGQAKPGFTDSGRVPMPWDKLDRATMDAFRQLLAARRAHPALVRGARWPLAVDATSIAFVKVAGSDRVLVVSNSGAEERTMALEPRLLPGRPAATALVGGAQVVPSGHDGGGAVTLRLPPFSTSYVALD